MIVQSSSFINSLAVLPPSKEYPGGLVASAGKDTVIDVREPGAAPDSNAERLLLGHAHNVCTLDAPADGRHLVSGGWDKQARVWDIERAETVAELKGHEASVWAVLVYDDKHILTACADRHIRVFHPHGKLLNDIGELPDVVRALCKLPDRHSSGAAFASAGNDQIIRLWTLDGVEIGQLHGHEAFIYSLAALPNGDIVSSSEDRTVRVWRDGACIQTITHPAISVWTVAVCQENGDIATGASDRMVRVFTRDPQRQADPETIQTFEDSVRASSIPQQTTGDGENINKEKLPGPEFLTSKSGTKEGQVQMIREDNGNVTAHTWSTAAQQWINVGTVVDSAGSSGRKVSHNGRDYDYVFDVDIEDGKPALKLPYNASQNPYEVAQKFIADNELPITYLDQVANFILQNTQGANIGNSAQGPAAGSDPWGTGNRYRPDETPAAPREDARPRTLPQKQYLSITTANIPAIRKKIAELNESEDPSVKLSPEEMSMLDSLTKQLQSSPRSPQLEPAQLDVVLKMATEWSPAARLPGLDLLRLCAISPSFAKGRSDIVGQLTAADAFSQKDERPNNTMMAIRVLVNMFDSKEGLTVLEGASTQILDLIRPFASSTNKNLSAAIATILINFAVLLSSPAVKSSSEDGARKVASIASVLVEKTSDSETAYRSLVALGTLLSQGGSLKTAATGSAKVSQLITTVSSGPLGKEHRIKHLIQEMRDL